MYDYNISIKANEIMVSTGKITGLFTIILIIYIYQIQYSNGTYDTIYNEDLINSKILKTGDIILFKAANNFNSIFIGCYFGHIGIVYIDPDDDTKTPYLFEATGIEGSHFRDYHNQNGVFLTPLKERISKYKGRCWLKQLNRPLEEEKIRDFRVFIDYCLENLKYNKKVIHASIQKFFGFARCNKGTNCGEIVFLSLIKLGLLDIKEFDKPRGHYLKWMCNITKCENQYAYNDIITEIIDHPFAT